MKEKDRRLRALCVARHAFLADHIARFFAGVGVDTKHAVGLGDALEVSRGFTPDLIVAEYELLTTLSLEARESDELLSHTPVVAVSLTRRQKEAHLLDVNGVAGFLYLPRLDSDTAVKLVHAAAASSRNRYVPSPATTSPGIDSEVARPQ